MREAAGLTQKFLLLLRARACLWAAEETVETHGINVPTPWAGSSFFFLIYFIDV